MAEFLHPDELRARALLAEAGVTLLREDSPERDALLIDVLDEESRFDRGTFVMEPLPPGEEFTAYGAWHINNAPEFHSILDGTGILEYVTPGGVVSVILGPGDVMAVRRAEHRYRPLVPQLWIGRFGGGPGAELVPTETGRISAPWPAV